MKKNEFIALVTPIAELVELKGQDYRNETSLEEYFPFGNQSYIQMIWTKVMRLKSVACRDAINFESLEDTLNDLIAYSVFFKAHLAPKPAALGVLPHKLFACVWHKDTYGEIEPILTGPEFFTIDKGFNKDDINAILTMNETEFWQETSPFGKGLKVTRLR